MIGALITNNDLVAAAKEEPALKGVFDFIKNINALYTLTNLTLEGIKFFLGS